MAEIAHLIESLSIGVVLIGFVVLSFLALSIEAWRHRRCQFDTHLMQVLGRDFRSVISWLGGEKYSWVIVAGALILASQLGTIFVRISDEILDSEELIASELFFYVPEFREIFNCKFGGFLNDWKDEDELRLIALKQVSRRTHFSPEVNDVMERHLPPYGGNFASAPKHDDSVKGFFLHANAVVISERGSAGQRDELRHDRHAVQLFSVIFVATWMLLLATLCGPVLSASVKALKGQGAYRSLYRAVLFLLLLWIFEGLILRLWTEQSRGSNRRLIHSYVTIASHGDPAMGIGIAEDP